MPTGELLLFGALAEPLGDLDNGFAQMTAMLNLSRLYNATASVAVLRRMFTESFSYANARDAFAKPIVDQPLVKATLLEMAVEWEAALHLLFFVCHLRGKVLAGSATIEEDKLMRMLTPMLKYYTAKMAVRMASEAVEMHGGNGYIEDWPLARFYRDAQVLPVWEGTTNILVLDTFRSMVKQGCQEAFFAYLEQKASSDHLKRAIAELKQSLPALLAGNEGQESAWKRKWCDRAVQCMQAALLLDNARDERGSLAAEQFLLSHFASDCTSIRPAFVGHGQENFAKLVAAAVK